MKKLATLLRAGQLFAHNAHNSTYGPAFFEDHEFFGETYDSLSKAYDDVVERGIGLDLVKCEELADIQREAAMLVPKAGKPEQMFYTISKMDYAVLDEIGALFKGRLSQGTQNLLQGIADATEKRCCFLIRRKLKTS